MLPLLVIFAFFSTGSAVPGCPDGYQFLNDWKCVQLFTDVKNYGDSFNACRSINADLVSVHNAIDNRRLAQLAAKIKTPVWLGLNCNSPVQNISCSWQDNTGRTNSYSNFAPGNPSVPEPVTMISYGANAGRWYSADGAITMAARFCAIAPGNQCPNSYLNYCYTTHRENATFADASQTCKTACGDLVSIHSSGENNFVRTLFQAYYPEPMYAHIGVVANRTAKVWVDGTPFDYDDFGYFNPNIGKYVAMALTYDASVGAGQWISVDDGSRLPFVCKKPLGLQCGPTLSPTLAPMNCGQTHFLDGNGTIYSPNYPYSYSGQQGTCTYIITAPQGSFPQVQFPEFAVDSYSKMSLYAFIENNEPPFLELSTKNEPNGWIKSSTNVLRMVFFRTNQVYAIDYEWKAIYSISDHA